MVRSCIGVSASRGGLNTEKHSQTKKVNINNSNSNSNNNKTYLVASSPSDHSVARTKSML